MGVLSDRRSYGQHYPARRAASHPDLRGPAGLDRRGAHRPAAFAPIARMEPLKRMSEPAWARALIGLAALRQGNRSGAETAWKGCAARTEVPGGLARQRVPPAGSLGPLPGLPPLNSTTPR